MANIARKYQNESEIIHVIKETLREDLHSPQSPEYKNFKRRQAHRMTIGGTKSESRKMFSLKPQNMEAELEEGEASNDGS